MASPLDGGKKEEREKKSSPMIKCLGHSSNFLRMEGRLDGQIIGLNPFEVGWKKGGGVTLRNPGA